MQLYNGRAAACAIKTRNVGVDAATNDSTGYVLYTASSSTTAEKHSNIRVDLHGLRVREAVQFLSSLINEHRASHTRVTVDAITGVGHNSLDGRPKLLPGVIRLLQHEQLAHQVHEGYVRFKV